MATRGNRPKDPADTKGGVRGTHGLGDAPRESPSAQIEGVESSGEEREFELSNAMSPVESSDDRAERREHEASEAKSEALDESEKKERSLATEVVPGPGPKDQKAGRATKKHLESHRLEPQRRH